MSADPASLPERQPDAPLMLASAFALCFVVIVWVLFVPVLQHYRGAWLAWAGPSAALPLETRALFGVSGWLSHTWWWFLPGLGVGLAALGRLLELRGQRYLYFGLLTLFTVALVLLADVAIYQTDPRHWTTLIK